MITSLFADDETGVQYFESFIWQIYIFLKFYDAPVLLEQRTELLWRSLLKKTACVSCSPPPKVYYNLVRSLFNVQF